MITLLMCSSKDGSSEVISLFILHKKIKCKLFFKAQYVFGISDH